MRVVDNIVVSAPEEPSREELLRARIGPLLERALLAEEAAEKARQSSLGACVDCAHVVYQNLGLLQQECAHPLFKRPGRFDVRSGRVEGETYPCTYEVRSDVYYNESGICGVRGLLFERASRWRLLDRWLKGRR